MGVLAYFVYINSSCIIFSAKLFQNSQYIYYSQKNQQSTHICLDVSTCFGLGVLAHFGSKSETRKINKIHQDFRWTTCFKMSWYSHVVYYWRVLKTFHLLSMLPSHNWLHLFFLISWQAPIPPSFWIPRYRH